MQSSSDSFWSEIKAYEERLRQDPASYCFAPLAEVYLRAGLLEDALTTARNGVRRYPGYVAGQLALARVCHQKGLPDECRTALEVVTGAVPEHAEAQRLLARLYAEAGQLPEAVRALEVLLEFSPAEISAQLELEALRRRLAGQPDEEELELIEFTEADIIEEYTGETPALQTPSAPAESVVADDTLIARVKPPQLPVDDPWAGIGTAPVAVAAAGAAVAAAAPAAAEALDAVWGDLAAPTMPEAQPAAVPPVSQTPESLWAAALPEVAAADDDEAAENSWPEPELPEPAESAAEGDPLSTPTLAELYLSQGYTDKAIAIYRRFVQAHPENREAAERLALLEQHVSVAADQAVAAAAEPSVVADLPASGAADRPGAVAVLEGWLENIRRLKSCR